LGNLCARVPIPIMYSTVANKHTTLRLDLLDQLAPLHAISSSPRRCSARWFERTARPAQVKTIYSFKADLIKVPDGFEVSPDW
jgi:hypothetical protein